VAVGDRVFGFSAEEGAQAELAVPSSYAPIPPSMDFPGAAALPAAIETDAHALDQLGVEAAVRCSSTAPPGAQEHGVKFSSGDAGKSVGPIDKERSATKSGVV
jgi:NADPH:quinone reductase-like Zn-dependent oxidoreductase